MSFSPRIPPPDAAAQGGDLFSLAAVRSADVDLVCHNITYLTAFTGAV
jgi:hypothetical protein